MAAAAAAGSFIDDSDANCGSLVGKVHRHKESAEMVHSDPHDNVIESAELRLGNLCSTSSLRDSDQRNDDVVISTNSQKSFHDDDSVNSPGDLRKDNKSFCGSGRTVDKSPESEMKRSSSSSLAVAVPVTSCELRHHHSGEIVTCNCRLLHSTPSAHCAAKSSTGTPVSVGQSRTDACDCQSLLTHVAATVPVATAGHSDGEKELRYESNTLHCQLTSVAGDPMSVSPTSHCDGRDELTNRCRSLLCQSPAAATVNEVNKAVTVSGVAVDDMRCCNGDISVTSAAALGGIDGDKAIASSSIALDIIHSCREAISAASKPAETSSEKNMATDGCHRHVPVPAAVAASKETETISTDSDRDIVAVNCLSPIAVTDSHCRQPQTTDTVCDELSELMQLHCLIGSQNSSAIDEVHENVISDCTDGHIEVFNSSASDEKRENVTVDCTSRSCVLNSAASNQVRDNVNHCTSGHSQVPNRTASDEKWENLIADSTDRRCVAGNELKECVRENELENCIGCHSQEQNPVTVGVVLECGQQESVSHDYTSSHSRVLDSAVSDVADVSDSFDLDAATRELERAVSAGMLDFLLESYEDSSDEDLSSEEDQQRLCDGLNDWEPALSLSDDSESTLTDESCVMTDDQTGDDVGVDEQSDSDVGVDESDDLGVNKEIGNVGIDETGGNVGVSEESGDLGIDEERGLGVVEPSASDGVGVDEEVDGLGVDNVSNDFGVREESDGHVGVDSESGNNVGVNKESDSDDVGINEQSDDDSDVWVRHERIRRRLKNAVDHHVAESDHDIDSVSDSDGDIDHVNEIDGVESEIIADSDTNDHSAAGSGLSTSDIKSVSVADDSVFNHITDSDGDGDVSSPCSIAAVSSSHHSSLPTRLNSTESSGKPTVGLPPSSVSEAADTAQQCDEAPLSCSELGRAVSTSTPSSSSDQSLRRTRSVIEWREGVYNGVCLHSDGSEIRMKS